jgi:hypothetical protein
MEDFLLFFVDDDLIDDIKNVDRGMMKMVNSIFFVDDVLDDLIDNLIFC